jgi:hypothetical protein
MSHYWRELIIQVYGKGGFLTSILAENTDNSFLYAQHKKILTG